MIDVMEVKCLNGHKIKTFWPIGHFPYIIPFFIYFLGERVKYKRQTINFRGFCKKYTDFDKATNIGILHTFFPTFSILEIGLQDLLESKVGVYLVK